MACHPMLSCKCISSSSSLVWSCDGAKIKSDRCIKGMVCNQKRGILSIQWSSGRYLRGCPLTGCFLLVIRRMILVIRMMKCFPRCGGSENLLSNLLVTDADSWGKLRIQRCGFLGFFEYSEWEELDNFLQM